MIRNVQVLLLLCLTLFTGFAVTSTVSYTSARNSLQKETESKTLPMATSAIYNSLTRDLKEPMTIASMMANDLFLRQALKNESSSSANIIAFLRDLQIQYHMQTVFLVPSDSKRYYHSRGILKTIHKTDPQDSWYYDFLIKPQLSEINVDTDTADLSRTSVFINNKIMENGKLLGMTGIGLSLKHMTALLNGYEKQYQRQVLLVSPKGKVALHGEQYPVSRHLEQIDDLGTARTETLLQQQGASLHFKHDGDTHYIISRWLPKLGVYLVVLQPLDDSFLWMIKPMLINLSVAVLATILVLWLTFQVLRRHREYIDKLVLTDKLTGLNNRQLLDRELPLLMANSQNLCCLIVDIDHFKQINDTYGHLCGDNLIRSLSEVFTGQTRHSDLICRWGGDEFVFILPNCYLSDATLFAERLRVTAEDHEICFEGRCVKVSLSLGLTRAVPSDTPRQLFDRADQALLRAKSSGRNRMGIDDGCGVITTVDPPEKLSPAPILDLPEHVTDNDAH